MATNPMQRKAKNSFLLGFLLMLLIAAIAVGFLLLQLVQSKKEMESLKATQKATYALKQDIASGTPITTELLTPVMQEQFRPMQLHQQALQKEARLVLT